MLMRTIRVEKLTRDYGHGKGVFDLSFDVQKGESFGFLGPNGAGKTTTIRHLMGFLKAKSGRCSIDGLDCWRESHLIQKKLGYIAGEINLFNDMTGSGFIKFMQAYRGIASKTRTEEMIERFDFDPDIRIKKMSKGMKQKLEIVTAFMHDPDILLFDEPTSGLDPLMKNRFIDLMTEEKRRGKTILMSSHLFEEVERICQRVGIIREGKLVAVDALDELKARQMKKYIVVFKDKESAAHFASEFIQSKLLSDYQVEVAVQENINDFIASLHRYPLANLLAPKQSLEEAFIQYYGD